MMNEQDYPGLYQSANTTANEAQRCYLTTVGIYSALLCIGTGVSIFSSTSQGYALIAAFLFFITLGLTLLLAFKRFEKTWYSARAVAESVKTRTWRYMMRVPPYDRPSVVEAHEGFCSNIGDILKENRDITKELCDESAATDAITAKMDHIRGLSLQERAILYKQHRIDEQRTWYNRKARENKALYKKWFFLMILFQTAALICLIVRIAVPTWEKLPTDVFAVAAGTALAWIQTRRFGELSTSYSLTTHEISIISSQAHPFADEEAFSRFVADAENAFSREHTQWSAKRDS
jgi:hypothetical protein